MEPDLHTLRGIMSVIILVTFIGLFVWTARGARDRFDDAANLVFDDDTPDAGGRS